MLPKRCYTDHCQSNFLPLSFESHCSIHMSQEQKFLANKVRFLGILDSHRRFPNIQKDNHKYTIHSNYRKYHVHCT